MNNFKIGDIIIALNDFFVPATGSTLYYYKYHRYKITNFLINTSGNVWVIELIKNKNNNKKSYKFGWFTEDELIKKFDCVRYQRKQKLIKIKNNNEFI